MHTYRLPLGGAKGRRRSTHLQAEAPAFAIIRICHQGVNAFDRSLHVYATTATRIAEKGTKVLPFRVYRVGVVTYTHTWKTYRIASLLVTPAEKIRVFHMDDLEDVEEAGSDGGSEQSRASDI